MIALVTGASSGLGRDMSIVLAHKGYDIIAVARNIDRLTELKNTVESETNQKVYIRTCELIDRNALYKLHEDIINEYSSIDILINNAGFGLCGDFIETDINKEINMIDTNVTALHILTKLFLQDMVKQNSGRIMNVASIAGFMPGPLMATYYATKGYVVRLTQAISHELKVNNLNVKVCALCPGPVDTNFNKTAQVKFSLNGANSMDVSKYAIDKMFKNKLILVPGAGVKIARFGAKIFPDMFMAKMCYGMQRKKL